MAGARAGRINVSLRRVAMVGAAMLFVLLGHITIVQAFGSQALNADRRNERPLLARFGHPRGDILTYDGTAIATSRPAGGGPYLYQRVYRHGEVYAPVTGHLSLYRSSGIEQAQGAVLSGDDAKVKVRSLVKDGGVEGADVRLTISDRAQWAAYQSLKAVGVPGAVVAINPATGAILALASYPSYDPNVLTTFDRSRLAETARGLRRAPGRPLLNRALRQTYPPGSTFKLVTTAAALGSGEYNPAGLVDAPARLPLPGTSAYVRNDPGCRDTRPTLLYAFQVSCDTAFATIGMQLGQDILRDQAEAFGFNEESLAIPVATTPSRFPTAPAMTRAQTALAAIGHHEDRATPLMIAMLSAAVANDGVLMRPYLVEEVRLADGSVINRAGPTPYRTAVPAPLARHLAAMMTTVTHAGGTGTGAAIPGVEVAAETAMSRAVPGAEDHALVTAFAPADKPEVAVGVVLEHPGARAANVAPIARAVIEAVLA
ncbi:peptidoglycan D,D-transpeptidase FtsI family protein [Nonomuraea turcica]|uniref:peptidoglycan D,D-transpeptidase FtsI family protein n=1 Tax=Nonomuraea sp. G32 TaxID=3067274 RepID=UPI00273B5617|nr:penicillin-binding transpeptidase domain-containing protein [Nonomuraea sp. G32]MDP4502904.1 penicillin-binding transpeptidase domain-containing protein [Nonomuraea sp. G32]